MNKQAIASALSTAREVLMFRHEMGGYVPRDVLTAIREIDAALGNDTTPLQCVGDDDQSFGVMPRSERLSSPAET